MQPRLLSALRSLLRRTIAPYSIVREPLRWLARIHLLPRVVWEKLPVQGVFTVRLAGRSTFRYVTSVGDGIGRVLYWGGAAAYEPETTSIFTALAAVSDTVLDVGANTGLYALLACAVNPNVRVIAVEPVPAVYQSLGCNVAVNEWGHRCSTRNEAWSDYVGVGALHMPFGDITTMARLGIDGFRGHAGSLIDVSVMRADDVCTGPSAISLVKIDVEGLEDRVLQGMHRILSQWHPAIIVECNLDGPFTAVQAILSEYGYSFYHLRSDGAIPVVDIAPDSHELHRNFLCIVHGPQHPLTIASA